MPGASMRMKNSFTSLRPRMHLPDVGYLALSNIESLLSSAATLDSITAVPTENDNATQDVILLLVLLDKPGQC